MQETAINAGGTSGPATSSATAVVPPSAAQITAQLLRNLTPGGKASRIAALLKKGAYVLQFQALTAGKAVIAWYYFPKAKGKLKPVLVATAQKTFTKAATINISIRLTTTGKQLLKHARQLKLTAKATFTPTGKPASTATKTFTLKR